MLLCQITDLHVTRADTLACGRVDTFSALHRAVRAINALHPRPDAVIATGDLVDSAHASEYERFREALSALALPLFLVVGNHDHRDALRETFPEHAYLQEGGEFVQYRRDLGPVTLIALDTQLPPQPGGHLCQARLAWLDEQLAACAGRPTLIAMHHPPFDTGIAFMDGMGLSAEGRSGLAEVLARHRHADRVIAGHLHRHITAPMAGASHVLASTCVSTAHQISLTLSPDLPESISLEPPGFGLHLWQPGAGWRSHLAYVGPFDGPFGFDGSPVVSR